MNKAPKKAIFLDFVMQDGFGFWFGLILGGGVDRVEGWGGYTPHIGLSSLSAICSRATPVTSSHQTSRQETTSKPEGFYLAHKAKHHFQLEALCCI